MPLFKCQKCDHTFTDKFKPIRCPECGREVLRDATPAEYSSFFTPMISALRERYSPSMTRDERNWTRILMHMNPPQGGYGWRFLVTAYLVEDGSNHACHLSQHAVVCVFHHLHHTAGQAQFPAPCPYIHPVVGLQRLNGGILKNTGHFRVGERENPLYFGLKRPTLWNVNHIDLEKIATEPSDAYQAFLKAWADLFVDENHPMEGMLPKMNPFRVVDEHFIPDDDLPF